MTFHNPGFSAEHSDESKPTSRRRAGGKYKKPAHGDRSKFGPLQGRSRRSEFDDDFDGFDPDDMDDDLDDLNLIDEIDDDDDLDDFNVDEVDFDRDDER